MLGHDNRIHLYLALILQRRAKISCDSFMVALIRHVEYVSFVQQAQKERTRSNGPAL